MSSAVFLDRDGTLNPRPPAHEYLESADRFAWLPGAVSGVSRLASAGFDLFVVSNQRGVARGLISEVTLREIEDKIQSGLRARGCEIRAFRYCTHNLEAGCSCRKPEPGMIVDLARMYEVELTSSWMIGDDSSDDLAGRSAGCRTGLIGNAPGRPTVRGDSLGAVADLVLARL